MTYSRSNEHIASEEYDSNSNSWSRYKPVGRRERPPRSPTRGNLLLEFDDIIVQQPDDTPVTFKDMCAIFSSFDKSVVQTIKKDEMPRTFERGGKTNFVAEDFRRGRNKEISISEPRAHNGGRLGAKTSGRYDKGKGTMSSSKDAPYIPSRSSTPSSSDDPSLMGIPNHSRFHRSKREFTSAATSREDKWFKPKLQQCGLVELKKGMFNGNNYNTTTSPLCRKITISELPSKWRDVMDKYTGKIDPTTHLAEYLTKVQVYTYDERIARIVFPTTLGRDALSWFHELPQESITSFKQLKELFIMRFIVRTRASKSVSDLCNLYQRADENFRGYIDRFQATMLEVKNVIVETASNALARGITDLPLFESLTTRPLVGFSHLTKRARQHIKLNDAFRPNRVSKTNVMNRLQYLDDQAFNRTSSSDQIERHLGKRKDTDQYNIQLAQTFTSLNGRLAQGLMGIKEKRRKWQRL